MTDTLESRCARLQERFRDKLLSTQIDRGELSLTISPNDVLEVSLALRDEEEFDYQQLIDLCGVDYGSYGQADWETDDTTSTGFSRGVTPGVHDESKVKPARFAVAYQLLSIAHNNRLRVTAFVDTDPPCIDSVISVWASANWYEREAFDLFGVLFQGHPDLRRILTDYGFVGHPFRKDFPLEGNVEVRYDPDKRRVIYQPVTIKNRVLVPRVIRHDNRYVDPAQSGSAADSE